MPDLDPAHLHPNQEELDQADSTESALAAWGGRRGPSLAHVLADTRAQNPFAWRRARACVGAVCVLCCVVPCPSCLCFAFVARRVLRRLEAVIRGDVRLPSVSLVENFRGLASLNEPILTSCDGFASLQNFNNFHQKKNFEIESMEHF